MMHIALLEDDHDQRRLLSMWLSTSKHTCAEFETATELKSQLPTLQCDALILDWMLPDGTGEDVLKWIRSHQGSSLPIIVVTGRDDESTVVKALLGGADDYLVKPPKPMELLARLEAVTRRSKSQAPTMLRVGRYCMDLQAHQIALQDEIIQTTQKEFDLALYFFQHHGKLLSRDHLLNKIWGISADIDTRTVDTHVSRLRKKLLLDGSQGCKLTPIYGYGYRFDVNASAS
jgi:two-component system response regulator RegX3